MSRIYTLETQETPFRVHFEIQQIITSVLRYLFDGCTAHFCTVLQHLMRDVCIRSRTCATYDKCV
jgi:hypothetical protein